MTPQTTVDPQHRNLTWRTIQAILQNVFVFWLKYRATGIEKLPSGGALLLINHQSFLDPLLVGLPLKRPVSYLARDSLFRVPIVGWILRNTYVMPIRREAAGTESIRKSIERIQQGYYVGIFPEGTRTSDGTIGPIKPGFVALVRRTQVPVVPVGIAGALRALPRHAWFLRSTPVQVVYGDPLPEETVRQLCERGREQDFADLVHQRLDECRAEAERHLTASR